MDYRFEWTKIFSVSVDDLDEQHKHFFEIANELLDAVDHGALSKMDMRTLIDKLGNYALYHLSSEEEYFLRCGYTSTEDHIVAHDYFRNSMRGFSDGLDGVCAGPEEVKKKYLAEVALFSGHWLMQHILVVDKRYAEYIKNCVLKD